MSDNSIKIVLPELGRTIDADRGDNLLERIREGGIMMDADCGGVGRCGKCRVSIDGKVRLACLTHVVEDIEVLIPSEKSDEGYSILTAYEGSDVRGVAEYEDGGTRGGIQSTTRGIAGSSSPLPDEGSSGYAIAIDIGTTTVVGKLIDLANGLEVASFARLNAQRPYGADVISRIEASLDDPSELSLLITSQIDREIASLLATHGIKRSDVRKLVIAGNTTMSYILLGFPCRSLGSAPFRPAYPISDPYPYRDIFHTDTLACACDVLPFISAYVGGDLTAGLCSLRGENDFILMDMGTNGELLFKRGDRLIGTATAAGPAFEGGNIECGSGSTRGAISSVHYEDRAFIYKTIGAAPATSICGSGILDLMAILVSEGLVDATGRFSDDVEGDRIVLSQGFESTGIVGAAPVFFTQKDVRQFQLAKSAVRAGLEVLQEEMGGDTPSRVFLAGGFGQNLNPASACACGLLPATFRDRVIAVGNSSLSGAVKICLNDSARAETVKQIAKAQEINLASHRLFSDLFMEHMTFEVPE
ncbi:MAG: ASKHA domain-containing protein [Coriobacteriales bacterium]|nr:ASKHA domain-containing protein [Coriobacteriales bacterium]